MIVDGGSDGSPCGGMVRYTCRDRGGDGHADRALDGAKLDLALSGPRGYEVLYFTDEGSTLVFDKLVECDSFRLEKKGGRSDVVFMLRPVGEGAEDDGERLNPEAEAVLESIEAGTFVGETYTADEYIEYIRKALG